MRSCDTCLRGPEHNQNRYCNDCGDDLRFFVPLSKHEEDIKTKMLDLNQIRKEFADYLASNANKRHSLDAALMFVVEKAYQKGIDDSQTLSDALNLNDLADAYTTVANIDKDA